MELIARKAGVDISTIDLDTTIEDDLGVTGDDADELIKEVGKKFRVDINEFVFAKYFNDEPTLFVQYREVLPLTVGKLAEAIKMGKLV